MSMGMMGSSSHNLDSKGRLIIPARFRESLGNKFVLCHGMDQNIYVYPQDEWERFSEKLNALPISNPSSRLFRRFFQGSAATCEVDGQYRIVIPQELRNDAHIDKEVVMVGNGAIAEIWDKAAWEEINNPENMDINKIAAEISENYGI